MAVPQELLDLLICPQCKGDLILVSAETEGLDCSPCALRYPIRDNIPVMLVEEAIRITG